MSDYVRIFDTSLRDGEQAPGASMTSAEKLEVARALARLGVDVIEAGFPAASPDDLAAVQAIAAEVGQVAVAGRPQKNHRLSAGSLVVPAKILRRLGRALKGRNAHVFIRSSPPVIFIWNISCGCRVRRCSLVRSRWSLLLNRCAPTLSFRLRTRGGAIRYFCIKCSRR